MEQLLLVTSCDSPAGIGASLRTHGQRTDGWTDRRDVGNSILDVSKISIENSFNFLLKKNKMFNRTMSRNGILLFAYICKIYLTFQLLGFSTKVKKGKVSDK